MTFRNKDVSELALTHDFFDRRYTGKRFIFDDKLRTLRNRGTERVSKN